MSSPEMCVWGLSREHVERLTQDRSPRNTRDVAAEAYGLDESDEKEGFKLVYHYNNMRFALDQGFSRRTLSTFVTVMARALTFCISSASHDFSRTLVYFKELLLKHCVQRPPFSEEVFTVNEMSLIQTYALETLFRNFKLYKYIYQAKIEHCIVGAPPEDDQSVGVLSGCLSNQSIQDGSETDGGDEACESAANMLEGLLQTKQGKDLETIIKISLKKQMYKFEGSILTELNDVKEKLGAK